ncbi:MAG: VOC family protein, partial [Pseudomonadota bacterium]
MSIHLRQICLVAAELEPVVTQLERVFGLRRGFVDPAVAEFGLHNTLLPLGTDFLEVVAPVRTGTAAGRYLERRRGDGGYMVITQADSPATHEAMRARALALGVRVAYEVDRAPWRLTQLHPGDMEAAFLEVESDDRCDFSGQW